MTGRTQKFAGMSIYRSRTFLAVAFAGALAACQYAGSQVSPEAGPTPAQTQTQEAAEPRAQPEGAGPGQPRNWS
jgi:hypothetical protein